jgi:hypothetical protein
MMENLENNFFGVFQFSRKLEKYKTSISKKIF